MISEPEKRSYHNWTLDDDIYLYSLCKDAKRRKIPLTRLFEQISEEFNRKPQTIAQHYYTEIKPREAELAKIAENPPQEFNYRPATNKPTSRFDNMNHNDSIGIPREGAIIEGTIENIAPFGVFIRLDNELRGLLHISKISNDYIDDLNTMFKVGQRIKAKVESIDDNGRLSFSTIGIDDYGSTKSTDFKQPEILKIKDTAQQSNYYKMLNSYCHLQDLLRQFQLQVLDFKHQLSTCEVEDTLLEEFNKFADRCLEI